MIPDLGSRIRNIGTVGTVPCLRKNTRETDLGLGGGLPGLSGEDGGEDAEDGEALEAELGEGLLVLVHKELTGKEVAGHKLLQAQRLQADTDQSISREGSLLLISYLLPNIRVRYVKWNNDLHL